jgi:hypothetical protein
VLEKKILRLLMMCFSRQRKSKQVGSNEGAHQSERERGGKSKRRSLARPLSQIESCAAFGILRTPYFYFSLSLIPPTRSRAKSSKAESELDGVGRSQTDFSAVVGISNLIVGAAAGTLCQRRRASHPHANPHTHPRLHQA